MKDLIFDNPFQKKGQVLFNFGARDDPNIKIRKSFDEIAMAVEAGDTSAHSLSPSGTLLFSGLTMMI